MDGPPRIKRQPPHPFSRPDQGQELTFGVIDAVFVFYGSIARRLLSEFEFGLNSVTPAIPPYPESFLYLYI
jgi:hypothetical protein